MSDREPSLDLPAATAALGSALDAQTVLLDALVQTTQTQIAVLVELRVRHDAGLRLAPVQVQIDELTRRLEPVLGEVHARSLDVAEALGLPPARRSLTELTLALPWKGDAGDGNDLRAKVSALRSLGQALAELQTVAQAHAQRGLQAVAVWRAALSAPNADAGATYTRRGRARIKQDSGLPAMRVNMDL